MSTSIMTMTYPLPLQALDNWGKAIVKDEIPYDDSVPVEHILYTNTRNWRLESLLNKVVKLYAPGTLAYLSRRIDPSSDLIARNVTVVEVLEGLGLTTAIHQLSQLVDALRQNPERCAPLFEFQTRNPAGEIVKSLSEIPVSMEEALAAYRSYSHANFDEDDLYAVTGFLLAHRAVLQYAQERDMVAIFVMPSW